MSNSHPEPGRARPGLFPAVPWREVLLANGFASVAFGAAALAAAARYSGRAHDWARAASADDFARVVRLAALVYLLYGLVTLGAGLVWLAVGVYGARRRAGPAGRGTGRVTSGATNQSGGGVMGIDDEAARLLAQLAAEDGVTVSVGLFGQPGAGKSSLINALVGGDVAAVGVRTDTTTGREEYEWNGLTLVDLPGYGTARFPAGDYFARFGVLGFDLLLCVFDGKFRQADTDLFREVARAGKVTLFVRTKHDSLFQPGRTTADLERDVAEAVAAQVGSSPPVYFISAKDGTGLGPLAAAVGDALAPAKRDRWVRAARAYTRDFLDAKKAVCERRVSMAAGLAAVGGGAAALAPIPGTNLLGDVPVLLELFGFIRATYGRADTASLAARAAPVVGPAVNSVVKYATTDGVVALLGQFAGRQAAQTAARVVPFVGPLFAGGIGYALVARAGRSYLDDSHRVAEAILEREVGG